MCLTPEFLVALSELSCQVNDSNHYRNSADNLGHQGSRFYPFFFGLHLYPPTE